MQSRTKKREEKVEKEIKELTIAGMMKPALKYGGSGEEDDSIKKAKLQQFLAVSEYADESELTILLDGSNADRMKLADVLNDYISTKRMPAVRRITACTPSGWRCTFEKVS